MITLQEAMMSSGGIESYKSLTNILSYGQEKR